MEISAYRLAERFLGMREKPGEENNPAIVAMLHHASKGWANRDQIPWCAAFVYHICWLLDLPRPDINANQRLAENQALRARAYLLCGDPISLTQARIGPDIIVLKRGRGQQPGPETLDAPGHVGFYAGHTGDYIHVLGGNQTNAVTVQEFLRRDLLGVCRLHPPLAIDGDGSLLSPAPALS